VEHWHYAALTAAHQLALTWLSGCPLRNSRTLAVWLDDAAVGGDEAEDDDKMM